MGAESQVIFMRGFLQSGAWRRWIFSFAAFAIYAAAGLASESPARAPVIRIGPADLDLPLAPEAPSHPNRGGKKNRDAKTAATDATGFGLRRQLTLTLINQTGKTSGFSKFFDCWSPIILTPSGEVFPIPATRDVTDAPHSKDYVSLRPGAATSITVPCGIVSTSKGHSFITGDWSGTLFMFPVSTGGNYKLCVRYLSATRGDSLYRSRERLGIRPEKFWDGWTVSNWINIRVGYSPIQKQQ